MYLETACCIFPLMSRSVLAMVCAVQSPRRCTRGSRSIWELEQRITVLNNRFEVLTELLNIVREHENNLHIARCAP